MSQIAIVEYGMGNYHSVERALRHAAPDADIELTGEAERILSADRVVLPGQGAMADCMRTLKQAGLDQVVVRISQDRPLLGICVGEQMLFEKSEEGDTPCLGLFAGYVQHFSGPMFESVAGQPHLKIPHMGWNPVRQMHAHPLWKGIENNAPFYFVHSYHVVVDDPNVVVGQADYGYPFACAVARDNVFAVQFHPEKSADAGLRLLRNFVDWNP